MSDVTQSYTPGTHPDMPPPAGQSGILLWLRKNLFSSWINTIMTIIGVYLLYKIIPPIFSWAVLDSVMEAGSREECHAISNGACWAFIKSRTSILIYGFYPEELRWRVDLSFVLLLAALVPILFDNAPMRKLWMLFSVAYPFIAGWLLLGGLGLEHVGTDEFGGMLLNTVVGVTGISFSLPIGILLALGRQSHLPIVKSISVCFIEFIRGVPLITLLFVASTMLNYFLPPGTTFDLLLRVLIMVTLFASAYIAEVVRGGLQAIPNGQYEAANSMGLKYWQSMRLIVLPQALKISIPGIVNTFIGLFKDTTLVLIIGLLDILGIGRASMADAKWNGLSNEVYISIAVFFFIACFSMSRYSIYLEGKLDKGYKR
ncbi:amino acid ABC transporter permease [Thalassospiraceae bacterium LMO-JJ14]|nr:amino acid ABC transporter permease [Thalassospiraceae bacterium LMO-JJ14]